MPGPITPHHPHRTPNTTKERSNASTQTSDTLVLPASIESEVADLEQLVTAVELLAESRDTLDRRSTGAAYFLACLAVARAAALRKAIEGAARD